MRKNRLITLLSSIALAVSGIAAIGASATSNKAKSVNAEENTKKIYCKMEYSWWTDGGAAIGAYCFGGASGEKKAFPGERMTSEGNNVWSIDVDPVAYPKIIFVRVNPSGTISNWGSQSYDLDVPTDDKNYFLITSSTAKWDGAKVDGEWKTYHPEITTSDVIVRNYYTNICTPLVWDGSQQNEGSIALTKNDAVERRDYFKVIRLDSNNCESEWYGFTKNLSNGDGQARKAGQLTNDASDNICLNIDGTYTFNVYFKPNESMIYIPQVSTNATLTFEVDSSSTGFGSVSPTSVSVAKNSPITVNGNVITVDGNTITATPTADTDQYDYEFSGWSNVPATTASDATITANFTRTTRNYLISFVDYDDTPIKSQSYAYGQTPSCTAPTRDPDQQYTYTFADWNPAITSVTGAQTYKATYTPTLRQYALAYSLGDATLVSGPAAGNYDYGTVILTAPVATLGVKTLEGWYSDSGLSQKLSFPYTITGPITLYPKFVESAKNLTITVNQNGYGLVNGQYQINTSATTGDSITINGSTLRIGNVDYVAVPTTAGAQYTYSFSNWTGVTSGTVVENDLDVTAVFTRALTKHTFQYEFNGGTPRGTEGVDWTKAGSYDFGTEITLPVMDKEGCSFKGWYDNASFTGSPYTSPFTLGEDVKLYAKFEGLTFDVDFEIYKGCEGYGTLSANIIEDVPYGSAVTVNGNKVTINGTTITATPTASGAQYTYEFVEWLDCPSTITQGEKIKANFSQTTNKYTITWDAGDGVITSGETEYTHGLVKYGTPIVAPEVSNPGYELASWSPALGYDPVVTKSEDFVANYRVPAGQYIVGNFNGWAANATGISMTTFEGGGEFDRAAYHVGADADNKEIQMIWVSSDNDYVPEWKEALSVTYYNSPSGRCMAGKSTEGQAGTISGKNAVLPMDLINKDEIIYEEGSFTIKTYKDGDDSKDYGRHYALILEEYKLEFDMGGHGTNPGTKYALCNDLFEKPTDPSTSGWSFGGWYTDNTYNEEFDFDAVVTENKVAYAKWEREAVEVTMTFDTKGGSAIDPIIGMSGDSYEKPDDPTKLNNTFDGWNPELPDVLPDENTTYTAQWIVNNGTYIAVNPSDSSFDGKYVMTANPDKSGEFYIDLSVVEGQKFKVYYANEGSTNWDDALHPTCSYNNPALKEFIKFDEYHNLVINTTRDLRIYFDTVNKNYHVQDRSLPENGYYFLINEGKADERLVLASPHAGWSGTEYKAEIDLSVGDTIKAYYQDSTKGESYILNMYESVKVFGVDDAGRLVCTDGSRYSLYMIAKDEQHQKYDYVSIFCEGESEAVDFAKKFNAAMDGVCNKDGETPLEDKDGKKGLKTIWSEQATAFVNMTGDAKAVEAAKKLLGSNTLSSSTNADLKKFAESYDYIYGKYGSSLGESGGDFADRKVTPQSGSRNLISIDNVSSSTWIIVSVAIVGIAAVGVFFIYRKRKEN